MPSTRSAENAASAHAWPSIARPLGRSTSDPVRRARLAARRLTGDLAAISAGQLQRGGPGRAGGTRRSASPAARLGGVDLAAGEDQLGGAVEPDPPRQQLGAAAAGDQAEPTSGSPKPRLLGGDDQVAAQRQLATPTEGVPSTAAIVGIGRFRTAPNAASNTRALRTEIIDIESCALLEIGTDAEGPVEALEMITTLSRRQPPARRTPRSSAAPGRWRARSAPPAGP